MSGAPHRTKTRHLPDFLRGPSSRHDPQSTIQFPDEALSDGAVSGDATASPSKRRSTRIPLFGRARKKSTPTEAVAPIEPRASEMQQGRTSTATNTSRAFVHEQSTQMRASLSQQSLTLQPAEQHSFGSKIVAHLTPSKTRGLLTPRKSRKSKPSSPSKKSEDISDYTSDTLSPPVHDMLPGSSEYMSSREDLRNSMQRRQSGSVTPTQPTITVSRPPLDMYEDLSEYEDLFTKPRQKGKSKPSPIQIPSPSDSKASTELSLTTSNPTSPEITTSFPPSITSVSSQTPTPTLSQPSSSKGLIASQPPLVPPLDEATSGGKLPTTGSDRLLTKIRQKSRSARHTGTDTEITSAAEESDAMSVMSLPLPGAPSTAKRRSITALLQDQRSATMLPYKPKERNRVSTLGPHTEPPTIPLPATPRASMSTSPSVRQRARAQTVVSSTSKPVRDEVSLKRHSSASSKVLLSSIPRSQEASDASRTGTPTDSTDKNRLSNSSTSSSSTPTVTKSLFPQLQPTTIDIDSASIEELRAAIRQSNAQFKELGGFLVKQMDMHSQEKALLEKKISSLEGEILRRDKEIKGLKWLIKGPRASESSGSLLQTDRSTATPDISDDSSARSSYPITPTSSIRLPVYVASEDSGAESYATSGAESPTHPALSGAESDPTSRPRRSMKKLKLVESFNRNQIPQPFTIRKAEGHALETVIGPSNISRLTKHASASSLYSTSSSGSSPFSSPTSTSFAAAGLAGLSSIPEASASAQSSAQRQKEKKERDRKISAGRLASPQPSKPSSTTIPTRPTPSEAYAMNLKKDRPPSIAQVLDHGSDTSATTPIMEESFGGRSRALLGLAPSKASTKTPR
ncbi:hypothetical protein VNI00_001486 [Paramarasmius palmivorus]|uniref:Uncharacterized protein n=1 Tax=Paramarasmius palmivorus TaxID=297713 RepID=A0AAW0E2F2_9AGAR